MPSHASSDVTNENPPTVTTASSWTPSCVKPPPRNRPSCREAHVTFDAEQADAQRAEDPVHQVDRGRADGIVDAEPVEEAHRLGDRHAGDRADDDRRLGRDVRARRGDRDQPREAAVDGHREVRLAVAPPDVQRGHQRARARGEIRGDRDARDRFGVQAHGRSGIEAEPAEPQDHPAQEHVAHVVARNARRLAPRRIAAEARAQHQDPGERRPAAHAVHDRGAREILHARARQEAAAPDPVARDRVEDPPSTRARTPGTSCISCAR